MTHQPPSAPSAVIPLVLSAAVLLVPANLLPVLHSTITGHRRTDTIFSGVVELAEHGLWPLALIVFVASFVVPFGKLAGLVTLLWVVRRGSVNPARWTRWYARLDWIGRWSMLDVFLAAFLAGIVQFGALAKVEAGPGLAAFAAAVVLTMLATRAFDPAQLWQSSRPGAGSSS